MTKSDQIRNLINTPYQQQKMKRMTIINCQVSRILKQRFIEEHLSHPNSFTELFYEEPRYSLTLRADYLRESTIPYVTSADPLFSQNNVR